MGRHLNPRPLEGYAGHLIMALNVRPFYKFIKKKKTRKTNISLGLDFKMSGPLNQF